MSGRLSARKSAGTSTRKTGASPGAAAIANQVKNAWPGAIVLMHDGGGDRSQTVEALKDALPYLKSQGYRFVTMDELLGYPLS